MKKEKVASLIILLIFAFISFISCSTGETINNAGDKSVTEENAANGDNNVEPTAENYLAALPSADFDRYEFVFIKPEPDGWACSDLIVTEDTGDLIPDAIYKRNLAVEEKYNITLKEVINGDPGGAFRKSVSAGDETYDAIYNRAAGMAALSTQAVLYNIFDIPNVELPNPWWDSKCAEQLSIAKKLYMITGDISVHYNDATWILMFNKQMIADFEMENPYELVFNGKWTLDKFNEMMGFAAADLDGDGVQSWDDRFGFISHAGTYNPFMFGTGARFYTKDSDDLPVLAMNTAIFADKFAKTVGILADTTKVADSNREKFLADRHNDGEWQLIFYNNRSLFFAEVLGTLARRKDAETDFGLLPLPKYDELQENYICTVLDSALVLGIPMNAANIDRTGLILEAMAAESYTTVIPAYYDLTLQFKLTKDEESIQILDTIRKDRIYEVGYIFNIGGMAGEIQNRMQKNDINIASFIEKFESRMENAVQKIVDAYTDNFR